jgi:hypothetical protein
MQYESYSTRELIIMSIGTIAFVSGVTFWSHKVWTLTAADYIAYIHRLRPRGFYEWPIIGAMAKRFESQPQLFLWSGRIWTFAAIPLAGFAIFVLVMMFKHRKVGG